MSGDGFNYTTKLWKRGENSYATTVPQPILAITNAPVENGEVEWTIDPETGDVIARFRERDEGDADE